MTTTAPPRSRASARPDPGSAPAVAAGPIPRAVWVVTLLHVALLTLYSIVVPTFRAPDEYVHVDMIRRVAQGEAYPRPDRHHFVAEPIIAARDTSRAYDSFAPPVAEGQAVARGDRRPFDELGDWDEDSRAVNQLTSHPPGYYVLAAPVYLAGEALAFDQHVWLLRMLSVLLVAPLPLLAWATVRRLGGRPPEALAAAVLVVAVPGLTHIGSVVNNDNLLILAGGVLTWLAVRVVTGDLGHRTALALGAAGGIALLAKGFGLFVAPWAVAAYAFPAVRGRLGAALVRALEAGALTLAIGGWWYVRNLVSYDGLQPGLSVLPDERNFDPDVWDYATTFVGRIAGGFWGTFGWREANLPWLVATIAAVLAAVGIVAAFLIRARVSRARLAYLLVPGALLFGGVAVHAWRAYLKRGEPAATQGRYLYAAVIGVAAVVAIGLHRLVGRQTGGWLPGAVLAAAVPLHLAALTVVVDRYWQGSGAIERLQSMLVFSPWPPAVVGAIAGVVIALAVLAGRALARERAAA